MILTNKIKENIKNEYETWFNEQYGNKSLEERRKLGAFFTPPDLTIKMIEKFETLENKTILDPTCGTGNLLAACVIAGANPTLVFGNEYDSTFVQLCKKRLSKLGVPDLYLYLSLYLRYRFVSSALHLRYLVTPWLSSGVL